MIGSPRAVVVIGGGLVGLGTALAILRRTPGSELVVLEKEPQIARHQSGHNSGVLHAGLYYRLGSAKAKLAVEGIRLMVTYCKDRRVHHEQCGKFVVATEAPEIPLLRVLHERVSPIGRSQSPFLVNALQRLVPAIEGDHLEPHGSGVRAQAMGPAGHLVDGLPFRRGAIFTARNQSPEPCSYLEHLYRAVRRGTPPASICSVASGVFIRYS